MVFAHAVARRTKADLPLAPKLPVIGSLPWLVKDAPEFFRRCAVEYGSLFRMRIGPGEVLVVAHPDGVRHVLQEASKRYIRGASLSMIRPMLGNGLPLSDPPFWLRQRRIMQPCFSRPKIASLVDTMTRVTRRHLDSLHDGQTLRAHDLMTHIARSIIVETMFSDSLGSDHTALDAAITEIEQYVARHMFLPVRIPLWLPLPDNRRFRAAIATLDQLVYGLIDKRATTRDRRDDLLQALIDARDPDTGETMSRTELRDEVMNIFFAGHETSANALTWATYLLDGHPSVTRALHAEVDGVLGGRDPSADDVRALEYTNAVLRETLRLYPAAWMFAREASEDDEILGYAIPRGTHVLVSPYTTHRLPEFWSDPERFDPERFVRDPSLGIGGGKNWSYFPFGGGGHVCIGNHFALTEAAIVLALVAQRGTLRVLDRRRVRARPAATLAVQDDLPVRFEARVRPS